ncbi:MAG: hypothetical protein HGA45_18050 [Chloroflexales bacterium]|nr:hypothetical protein [Chloroflexales bacterium]
MATRLLRITLAILGIACALAAGPSRAQAPVAAGQPAQLSLFGINTYFTGLERNSRDGDAGVSTLIGRGRQMGAAWAREELSWGNLERDGKGLWAWPHFDRRLLETAQAGYGIIGMLLTTPAWARVSDCGPRVGRYAAAGVVTEAYWCPPANPQDFADYVFAVVERYDGDGNADAPGSPRVAAWQIWNEPNAWETWPGSPAEYAAILEAGYAAAKAADPTATVAPGGLYVLDSAWKDEVGHWDGLRFFDEALAARPAIWRSFDALAVHPYMPDVAPDQPGLYGAVTLWGRLTTARSWLNERTARLGGSARPIWISELGWSTCSAAESDCYAGAALSASNPLAPDWRLTLGPTASRAYAAEPCLEEAGACAARLAAPGPAALIGKSEQQQASYMARAYAIAIALGVQHISWFQLEDKFDGSARNFWEEAALYRTAALGYAPKPAVAAYSVMASQIGGAAFAGLGPLHSFAYDPGGPSPDARFHLRFRTPDYALVEMLWRTSGAEEVALPLAGGATPQIFSRDGVPLPVRIAGGLAHFSIGEAPVYVRQRTWTATTRLILPILWR